MSSDHTEFPGPEFYTLNTVFGEQLYVPSVEDITCLTEAAAHGNFCFSAPRINFLTYLLTFARRVSSNPSFSSLSWVPSYASRRRAAPRRAAPPAHRLGVWRVCGVFFPGRWIIYLRRAPANFRPADKRGTVEASDVYSGNRECVPVEKMSLWAPGTLATRLARIRILMTLTGRSMIVMTRRQSRSKFAKFTATSRHQFTLTLCSETIALTSSFIFIFIHHIPYVILFNFPCVYSTNIISITVTHGPCLTSRCCPAWQPVVFYVVECYDLTDIKRRLLLLPYLISECGVLLYFMYYVLYSTACYNPAVIW